MVSGLPHYSDQPANALIRHPRSAGVHVNSPACGGCPPSLPPPSTNPSVEGLSNEASAWLSQAGKPRVYEYGFRTRHVACAGSFGASRAVRAVVKNSGHLLVERNVDRAGIAMSLGCGVNVRRRNV